MADSLDRLPTAIDVTPTPGPREDGPAASRAAADDPWSESLRRLDDARTLRDDWDDEGDVVPSPELFDDAAELMEGLRRAGMPAPNGVGVGPNGSVLLEWHNGLKYFEIDLVAPRQAEWLLSVPGERPAGGDWAQGEALTGLRRVVS